MSSMKWTPKSIQVKIKATHFNDFINRNALNYTAKAVNEGAGSWIKPFLKPQLVGHDKQKDPIGRITGYQLARSDSVDEPADYIELTATINDQASIEKIMDGRYNTVSVGSRSTKVLCSECNQNIIEDGLCEHKKGAFNSKGNRIHWKIDQIDYVECSFVNEPADDYAGIDQIDIGFGFVPYKDFLDNQESLLTEATNTEVGMNDAVLSAKTRNALSDSSFCYVAGSGDNKVRKFPAHDAAHVRNGLARLSQAKLSDAIKGKILACLKRRAKRFGIDVTTKDAVFTADSVTYINSLDPLFGIHDEFTAAEQAEMDEFFKANPNFDDLPEAPAKTETATDQAAVETDPEKMKKDELLVAFKALQDKSKADNETKDTKIKALETQISEQGTILSSREDEVNRYIDQLASMEKKLRDAVINNIIDLKKSDTKEDRALAAAKLESRQLQSLVDTLADLRIEITTTDNTVENKDQVIDPTQVAGSGQKPPEQPAKTETDPWSVFGQDNRLAEVE